MALSPIVAAHCAVCGWTMANVPLTDGVESIVFECRNKHCRQASLRFARWADAATVRFDLLDDAPVAPPPKTGRGPGRAA